MERVGIQPLTTHGGKEQDNRLQVMEEFKKGDIKLLITTDANARGIDIPNVDYVVNYDPPDVPENCVHRAGRTGRGVAERPGARLLFCSEEWKSRCWKRSRNTWVKRSLPMREINKNDYRENHKFLRRHP